MKFDILNSWSGAVQFTAEIEWAITLGGEKGRALEERFGPKTAGKLIYLKSDPVRPSPFFFATNERTMADIRRRAALQMAEANPQPQPKA